MWEKRKTIEGFPKSTCFMCIYHFTNAHSCFHYEHFHLMIILKNLFVLGESSSTSAFVVIVNVSKNRSQLYIARCTFLLPFFMLMKAVLQISHEIALIALLFYI